MNRISFGIDPGTGDSAFYFACLNKGPEHYIFFYDAEHRAEVVSMMGQFAKHPELSFTVDDACRMMQVI